jgi:uncharacterized protein YbcC (UPF0753/DUF2309 family)
MSHAASLDDAIEHLRHVLPAQGPIGTFVHHNTLHFLQHRSFHDAVREACERTGAEGYLSEERFRAELASGRITPEDIEAVLHRRSAALGPQWAGVLSSYELERLVLMHGVDTTTRAGLAFLVEEREMLRRFRDDVAPEARAKILRSNAEWLRESDDRALDALAPHATAVGLRERFERDPEHAAVSALFAASRVLLRGARGSADPMLARLGVDRTHRDALRAVTGEDPCERADLWIVRFLSAFLDERVARWAMPHRERGLLASAATQLRSGVFAREPALREAGERIERAGVGGATPLIEACLVEFGVRAQDRQSYVERAVLALPGWAGMVSRLESFPSDRLEGAPPVSLREFVALRLALDLAFVREAAVAMGHEGPPSELRGALRGWRRDSALDPALDAAYRVFQLAQLAGLSARELLAARTEGALSILHGLDALEPWDRRRLLHEAYERRHLREVLAAIADNVAQPADPPDKDPRFQVAFCIDDREEAIRRHFEELDPRHATFGVAGFFGIAMDWASIDDPQSAAQCPVVVTPAHVVREVATDTDAAVFARRLARRALAARARREIADGSGSLIRGVALTPVIGAFSAWSMTVRVLFPRAAARWSHWVREKLVPTPKTVLSTQREAAIEGASVRPPRVSLRPSGAPKEEKPAGFTADERVSRVRATLEAIGLTRGFAGLVALLGHGASTVNNPHHSAYECGACGGHNGGPNARAFAAMANEPEVREGLRAAGIDVPDTTWFIGGWHDTTTDAITLFDEQTVPAALRGELAAFRLALDEARARSAHERCRKFEHAPARLTPAQALVHVEERAVDLSQARPELGHATNAVAFVGRRENTRGLFLDRRAFLVSYDPTLDRGHAVLERVLAAVVPVGAGINLEYYFSTVDPERWGAGTKLPHNLAALLGVQEGASGDLRTGLPRQMTEIHEPVRLLCVVEASPEALLQVAKNNAEVMELVANEWVRLVSLHPETRAMSLFVDGAFVPYDPDAVSLPVHSQSAERYSGVMGSIAPAKIVRKLGGSDGPVRASAEVTR